MTGGRIFPFVVLNIGWKGKISFSVNIRYANYDRFWNLIYPFKTKKLNQAYNMYKILICRTI